MPFPITEMLKDHNESKYWNSPDFQWCLNTVWNLIYRSIYFWRPLRFVMESCSYSALWSPSCSWEVLRVHLRWVDYIWDRHPYAGTPTWSFHRGCCSSREILGPFSLVLTSSYPALLYLFGSYLRSCEFPVDFECETSRTSQMYILSFWQLVHLCASPGGPNS